MNRGDSLDEEISIGQMAKLNRISEKTLRVYHKKGILQPSRVEQDTGFRYYTLPQCATLDMIQQMKTLGFSLDDIGGILRENDVDLLESRICSRLEEIEAELAHLNLVKNMGESILENCNFFTNHPAFRVVHYEMLPERRIIRLAPMEIISNIASEEVAPTWERVLRELKPKFLDGTYPFTLFRNISDTIPLSNLQSGDLQYGDAIAFVNKTYGELFDTAEIVPEGLFATYYDNRFSNDSGRYAETEVAKQMIEDLRHKGYEMTGDYIGEVIAETPVFCADRGKMLARLQIPVIPKS